MAIRLNKLSPEPQVLFQQVMIRYQLSNADLVSASSKQLTFKMVQKAVKGRALTPNAQHKILEALRTLKPEEDIKISDLFN